jgi:hypothetical protein
VSTKKSSCGQFIDQLLSLTLLGGGDAWLGRVMGGLALGLGTDAKKKPTDGFKTELIGRNREQGGDVYKHILGHAGATLIGNSYVNPNPLYRGVLGNLETGNMRSQRELDSDWAQLNNASVDHTVEEIHAEINGDYIGRKVGDILKGLTSGTVSTSNARKQIFNKLCDR